MYTTINPVTKKPLIWRAINYVHYKLKTFIGGVLSQFVNFYYGNTAGFYFNFGAKKELHGYRKKFLSGEIPKLSSQHSKAAQQLTEFGYTLIGKTSSSDTINAAVKKVQSSFLDRNLHVASPNGASIHLLNPEKIPEIQKVFNNHIRNILIAHFGCAFRIQTVRIWRNLHVPGADSEKHDVFSNTFHHDNTRVTGLKIFILLTDGVNRDTGSFRFHNAKASRRIVRCFGYFHRFMQTKGMLRRLTNPKTLHFFEGDAGDCAIVNTQECLHAASIPKQGSHRDILQFEVYPDEGKVKDTVALFSTMSPDEEILKYKKDEETPKHPK